MKRTISLKALHGEETTLFKQPEKVKAWDKRQSLKVDRKASKAAKKDKTPDEKDRGASCTGKQKDKYFN